MSELILCTGRLATNPYYILTGNTNVYSIEELAYFICNNVYLIDESIMSEKLCAWVSEELHLPVLSRDLMDSMKGFNTLASFVGTILEGSGYCSENEIAKVKKVLNEIGNKNEFFRRKHKADMMLATKKYNQSIYEYKKLLSYYGTRNEAPENVGVVWHNMGTAYARLFLFEDACDCFEKAYELNKNDESYIQFKYAMTMVSEKSKQRLDRKVFVSHDELEVTKEELKEFEDSISTETSKIINELKETKSAGKISDYYGEINEILTQWKKECRAAIE